MAPDSRLISVISTGRRFTENPAIVKRQSGVPRSVIGPKEAPLKLPSPDRKR